MAEACWIGRDNPNPPAVVGSQPAAPMLRRGFTLPSEVASAALTVVGFGYCRAHINGQPVSAAVLDPPPSQYDKTVFSRTIDVTSLLRAGENAVGVVLGRAYVSGIAGPGARWTSEPRVLAQLDVMFTNGQTRRVVTDGAWKMADSPIHDWMYFGEHYDAREEIPGWTLPSYDDSTWMAAPVHEPPTATIVPATAPPVAVVDTFDAVGSTTLSSGATVYDFGKITAGWVRLSVRGGVGTTVQLSYGQQLADDGSVVLVPPVGSSEPMTHVDTYILSGRGREVWEPSFTRHGYQYVQVSVDGEDLEEVAVEARECYTPVRSTGSFTCSHPIVNKLHDNHRRSLLLNHWGFPTDTSWRDRQGWTADTALFLDSGILNFAGLRHVYLDWLRSLRDTQQADGSVSIFAPDSFGYPLYNDPSWSGMLILIPWMLYQHFGDTCVLKDNYGAMTSWMDLMDTTIATTGDLYTGVCIGDHASPGSEAGGTLALSPPEGGTLTGNAHLFQEARTLASIAGLLHEGAAMERYERIASRILAAFNTAFFDTAADVYRTPGHDGYRQTSNLLPLAFDMVPEGHEDAVFANLVRDLEARGSRLDTGAVGTKLLLPVLTQHGRGDLAYEVLTQTEYPSWGYWVSQGATSSWETWRNEGPDQTLDHPFLGTFDEWLYQHLAGIQAADAGYDAVRIAPLFAADLQHVSASVTTPHGEITSSWQRSGDVITLAVTLPDDVRTQLVLPIASNRVEVLAGNLTRVNEADGRTDYRITSNEVTVRVTNRS